MFDVPNFTRAPIFFLLTSGRIYHAIRTCAHNVRHAIAKAVANVCQTRLAPLIFNRIVQQRGDGHVFRATIFKHGRCNREEMCDIRDRRFFADLTAVNVGAPFDPLG